MSSDSIDPLLLDYYQRELTWLRHAGADFAAHYPKVARRLDLSGEESTDPHVERLLEGFAFLNARLQRRLDDDFSQLTDALLEQLYPYALRPMPSAGIVQFEPDATKGSLVEGYAIPRDTALYATTNTGDSIHFRTTAPVTVWPIEISEVSLLPTEEAQGLTSMGDARAALRLRIRCQAPHRWSELKLTSLRVHLAGSPISAATLYDLMCAHAIGVFVAPEGMPARYQPDALPKPVGFDTDDALLPLEDGVLPAYRLLLEYFAFPAKFMFFDLPIRIPADAGEHLELVIAFDRAPSQRLTLRPSDIALGCCPGLNLFPRTSEPLRPDGTRSEYRLVADSHRESSHEIYAVRQLRAGNNEGAYVAPAYFEFSHGMQATGTWWHARRVSGVTRGRPGSEILVTWVDENFDPDSTPNHTLTAELLCTNRGLAEGLPAGTSLSFQRTGPVARARLLSKPTPQTPAPLAGASRWRLISQLSLNHLSLVEDAQPLAALQEILALYNLNDSQTARQQITGITRLETRRAVAHVGRQAWRGWRNGLEVRLTLDEVNFTGTSRVLFSGVVGHFLAQYASINRFVRTVLVEQDRDIKTWQPLVGDPLIL
ncbi:type VI secretion system baseplate subunit TssF [Jeongeupia wiesaeckerbachi]|uniref:type VI secretion system baseplate subunit TssF n=1 Tax=Jeongeupia wiesaeckerbachi TaxID=3051218 RepID=UPI003D809813